MFGASVGFRPNMVPGLALWFGADVNVSLAGGKVASIGNQGSASNDPSQSNASIRPTISPAVNAGLPGLVFDGASNLDFPQNVIGNTGTGFLVLSGIGANPSYANAWAFDGPAMYVGFGGFPPNEFGTFDGTAFIDGGNIPNLPTLLELNATSAPLISIQINGGVPVTSETSFTVGRGASSFGSNGPGIVNPAAVTRLSRDIGIQHRNFCGTLPLCRWYSERR